MAKLKQMNPAIALQCGPVEVCAMEAGRTSDGITASLQATVDGNPIALRQVHLMKVDDRQQFAQEISSATGRDSVEVDRALMSLAGEIDSALREQSKAAPTQESFVIRDDGTYFQEPNDRLVKFCDRLDVVACTRSIEGNEWGRWLRFRDADGRVKEWALPMALLAAEGAAYRERLLSMGLRLEPGAKERNYLATYLQTMTPGQRMMCTPMTGWHGDHFVLPDVTIGAASEEAIVFQSMAVIEHAFAVSGSLEDWKTHVASLCVGNSRLVFAVSVALASALLEIAGEDSGGFHLRGLSSTGKTSALIVAGSLWGGGARGYIRRWRATANGLEAIAAAHNDSLLCLDELSQVDPREAGEIAYQLANGSGKQRANRSGGSRSATHWRLLFLSTGEVSLADHMLTGGKRQRAGQLVRMVDIPADAGAGLGLFQTLHGCPDADSFARLIQANAKRYYGMAIRAFLERLTNERHSDRQSIADAIAHYREQFCALFAPTETSGEVSRVIGRFSLVAAAGELAAEYNIVPWDHCEALMAAGTCFNAWLEGRSGSNSTDTDALIAQIRAFIEQHGASRFAAVDDPNDARVINRAGFVKKEANLLQEYMFLPETFRQEVCKGYDAKLALSELRKRGLLIAGTDDKPSTLVRPRGSAPVRVYRISATILE